MIEEIMKQYDIDRFNELMKFKIAQEEYITCYKDKIFDCISFLLKDGTNYYILEKGLKNDERWNAPYKIDYVENFDLYNFDYKLFERTDCSLLLISKMKKEAVKMGLNVYDEFNKKMPNRLRPFNDEQPFYIEVLCETEDIDNVKLKTTFIKVLIEYNKYNRKDHHISMEYATGGSSHTLKNSDVKEEILDFFRCHNIKFEEKKQTVYTQLSIFDF